MPHLFHYLADFIEILVTIMCGKGGHNLRLLSPRVLQAISGYKDIEPEGHP